MCCFLFGFVGGRLHPLDLKHVVDLAVGDTVDVIHSGEIAESYPMQIHHVFEIKRVEATSDKTE